MSCFDANPTFRDWISSAVQGLFLLSLFALGVSCQQPVPQVQSYLEGRIAVAPRVDTLDDHGGFRVLVMRAQGRRVDTLGVATTDPDGRFGMTVTAPERGIYPLTLWAPQGERRLATTDYVVAPGDSGTLNARLPLEQQSLRVDSPENSTLRGYANAMSAYRRMWTRQLKEEASHSNTLIQSVRLTSSVLWSLWEESPGTYAGQLAAVRSLSLLEGWNDSLVAARAQKIESANPRYVDAVRTARRAKARIHGHQAALDLLDQFEARAETGPQTAGVRAVRIQTFLDSLQTEAALSAAQRLRSDYPETKWATWAGRTRYEAQHLMPGMTAPNLAVRTLNGDSLSLRALRGRPILLEYYQPGGTAYAQQLPIRNKLHDATRPDSVSFISISIEPDTIVNRVFLKNRQLSGHRVIAPQGREDPMVERYNVVDVPTWFLIDADGRIVAQYQNDVLLPLQLDLTRVLGGQSSSVRP